MVAAIFERPASFIGETVPVVGDDLTPQAYADAMTRKVGKRIGYHHIPREVFTSFGFPGAADLADMFDFYRRFPLYGAAHIASSRALYPHLKTFEARLHENQEAFPSLLA